MNKIIICGHGNYGTSVLRSIKMLAGESEGIVAIDFREDMDVTTLEQTVHESISENQTLFICDISNGTPFRCCCKERLANPNVYVIAGVNLSAILEIIFMDKEDISSLMDVMIETTKESIIAFR